jgi:hypothetical protein
MGAKARATSWVVVAVIAGLAGCGWALGGCGGGGSQQANTDGGGGDGTVMDGNPIPDSGRADMTAGRRLRQQGRRERRRVQRWPAGGQPLQPRRRPHVLAARRLVHDAR